MKVFLNRCPVCDKKVHLRSRFYGRYGVCPNGCFGSWKKVPADVKLCGWDPGRDVEASVFKGHEQDNKGIPHYWHLGCENVAVDEAGSCEVCTAILDGKLDKAPFIEAHKVCEEAHKKWVKSGFQAEPQKVLSEATRVFREMMGYNKKENRAPKPVKNQAFLLLEWENYYLRQKQDSLAYAVHEIIQGKHPPVT